MAKGPYYDYPSRRHMEALGRLCVAWGRLDHTLSVLLVSLSMRDTESSEASNIVSSALDFRDKIRLIRAFLHLYIAHEGMIEVVEEILNWADDTARNQRNRFVHDLWGPVEVKPDKAAKVSFHAAAKRPQSFQPKTLKTHDQTLVAPREIQKLHREIANKTLELGAFNFVIRDPRLKAKHGIWKPSAVAPSPSPAKHT